jgi:hypothetical protein
LNSRQCAQTLHQLRVLAAARVDVFTEDENHGCKAAGAEARARRKAAILT